MKLLRVNIRTGIITLFLFGGFFTLVPLAVLSSSWHPGPTLFGWLWAGFAGLMQGDATIRTGHIRVRKIFSFSVATIPMQNLNHIETRGFGNWERIVFHARDGRSYSVFLATARLCTAGQLNYAIERLNKAALNHRSRSRSAGTGGPVPEA